MAILESTEERLVVEAGSVFNRTTLTLDKTEGRALIERRVITWEREPVELELDEIAEVDVAAVPDPESGTEIQQPELRTRTGLVFTLLVADDEVDVTAHELRDFLGLQKAA